MHCNFDLWFEYSFWLGCILHSVSISWEVTLGLKQRKVHCPKSLFTKGMCCIVLFRHYKLQSIWPFQWGFARLLLGITPCILSGMLQGHFWGNQNMPKIIHTNICTLCHVYSCMKQLSWRTTDTCAVDFLHVPRVPGTQFLSSNMNGYYSYHTCKLVGL